MRQLHHELTFIYIFQLFPCIDQQNNFPVRKNYRKSLNIYRLGKLEDTPLPYDQLFADEVKSDEQLRPGDAIISDNTNIDSPDLLSNTIYEENLGKVRRVPKYFKTVET